VDALEEAELAAIDVAKTGHGRLIEQRIADRRVASRAQQPKRGLDVEVISGDIWSKAA
jgi:hypothetical protein